MSPLPRLADAAGTLGRFGMHLVEAAPTAWRHDRLFRIGAIGTGVTLAVLLLHLAGPHAAGLEPGGRHYDVEQRRIVPNRSDSGSAGSPLGSGPGGGTESGVPKIAPGQSLDAAPPPSSPALGADRFGTFTPPPQRQP